MVLSASSSSPEDFAQACLDNLDFSESKVLQLFDLLPKDTSDRDANGVSFSGGVYCRIKVGLRKACHLFPRTLKVINSFASRVVPSHHYTSFVILDRVCTKVHVDTQNAYLPNVVVPLSSFAGGDILVKAKSPARLRVSQGPVSFCARVHEHSTSEAQGRRVVLVLFSLLGAVHLGSADRRLLRSLGFPLPTSEALECDHVQEPRELFGRPPSASPRDVVLPPTEKVHAPWLVEVCAGSAVLSATALRAGWNALPIDQPSCRFLAHTPLFSLDMRQSSSPVLLASFASRANVAWYHFGLPCGTCSRARERPLPNAPRPLRDADNLFGKAGLRPAEQEQVKAANQVYEQAVEVLFLAFSRGALVTLENPVRSWLWPLLAVLVKRRGPASFRQWYFALQDYDFDSCMFGSGRAKATRIKGSPHVFQGLSRACDGNHQHLGWAPVRRGQGWHFQTKDEAAYPVQLCDFLVAAAGARPSLKAEQWRARELRAQVRAPAGHQSRYAASLIPEFEYQATLAQVPSHREYKVLKLSSFGGSFAESSNPVGDAVGRPSSGMRGDQDSSSSSGMLGDQGSSSCSGMCGDQASAPSASNQDVQPNATKRHAGGPSDVVGVYHTMERHLQLASGLESPSEWAHQVPDTVRRNIFRLCTDGPLAVSKLRLQALNQLNSRLKELETQEAELRGGMHPDVEEVTRGKAICLFRNLLEESGFGDLSVVDSLVSGVELGGVEPECSLFPERHRPMQIHPDQLDAQAQIRREETMRRRPPSDPADSDALIAETAQEIEAGFLLGPFSSVEEVCEFLGCRCWSLSPRFLLRQGEDGKVRVIDDFSASAVNQSFESRSHLVLQDTDFTVGLLRFLSRVLLNKTEVVVPLSDGQVLRGAWSPEMLHSPPLLAKTIDLKKAYKQVAVRPSSWRHAVIGCPDKGDGWTFAVSRSLPFGATASVYAFNKLALALLHIMVVKFHAIATDFYDDYTVFEFQPAASLLDKVLCRLLKLLGWVFAEDGKKFVPFASQVVALGVVLNLEDIWNGRITIANKPGRVNKICSMLAPLAEGLPATRSQLASLHGLLNFAGGHVLGFQLKPAVRMFSKALARGRTSGDELRAAALLALDVLKVARPRTLLARVTPPVVLYTDGAYERGVASWGAILLDPLCGTRWMFHGTVGRELCDYWRKHAGEQIICEVEAYAVALVLYGLRGALRGRCIISFIDNDAARFGFIRRTSPSLCMSNIICLVTLLEAILETSLWYERVPSESNPSDLPSRGAFEEAVRRFGVLDKGDVAVSEHVLSMLVSKTYDPRLADAIAKAVRCEADMMSELYQ